MNSLNLLFPTKCCLCNKIGEELCKSCYEELKKYEIDRLDSNKFFIFKYDEKVRKLILNYKFYDKSYISRMFIKYIFYNKKICNFIKEYDIILPVPLHKKRKSARGYNQSELITKSISKKLKIKTYNNILIKTVNNKPQALTRKEDRLHNVKDVYIINNKEKVLNKKILLFDDVYTTGNTTNECKKLLEKAGAKEVGILTLAKD